jgi:hypothetical protein
MMNQTSQFRAGLTHLTMSHRNYLGAHRKRWALTKQELAHLIGYRARDPVSRCEASIREPTIRIVLGCEVVFGLSSRAIFPSLYDDVEEIVILRAAALDETLRGRDDPAAQRKRELLRRMVDRALTEPIV